MKKILLLAFTIIASITINAQDNTKINNNPNAPKLTFKSETIDYGEVNKGGDGVRSFEFTNEGLEPLIISNVRSSCGCTIPEYQRTPIGPGESSEIKVKYDTKRVGPFRKTITIYSNVEGGAKVLTIKGRIIDKKL